MNASIRIGKIAGIPVGLHFSWFLIFALLTWSLSSAYFPQEYPQLSGWLYVLLAAVTSIFFFASVLAHELGHSIIALRNQIPVKGITLFIFGGVAQIGQEPRSPGAEFRIAIAGPLVSLGLAGIFGLLWVVDHGIPYLAAPSIYLARINLILALFNMIPGFPLDGGRVLRSIVWWFTKSFRKATQVASVSGQLVAFGFIAFGVFLLFQGNLANGLWLAFIGWFLQNAAAATYAQMNLQESLSGVKVSQVMTSDCQQVQSLTPISQIVDERILTGGQRCFFVADEDELKGILTLKDISKLAQPKWRFTTAEQLMVPFSRLIKIDPDMELMTALQAMDQAEVAQIPVVEQGRITGMLTREQVLHYLRLRAELGI
ncbi:MAG: site-2 protease family protein [Anaerolineales bacterium]|nr:site-2 protease family protein [Anaerolineales bacterium]